MKKPSRRILALREHVAWCVGYDADLPTLLAGLRPGERPFEWREPSRDEPGSERLCVGDVSVAEITEAYLVATND